MNLNEYQRITLTMGDRIILENRMRLNDYQTDAIATAVYPEHLWYPSLGMGGEVFEFIEKLHDPQHGVGKETAKELGDVLWYVANVAQDAGLTLEEIAGVNKFSELRGYPEEEWLFPVLARGMGPVLESAKKTFRDDDGIVSETRRGKIKDGLKIVLNVLAEYAVENDTTLEAVAEGNIAKLKSRQERGVLKGSGDNR